MPGRDNDQLRARRLVVAVCAALAVTLPAVPAYADPGDLPSHRSPDSASQAGEKQTIVTVRAEGGTLTFSRQTAPNHAAARALRAAQAADPDVVGVYIDQRVRIAAETSDPLRDQQWALSATSFPAAHSRFTQGAGTVVAVVDSGVNGTHPDLRHRLVPGIDLVSPYGGNGNLDPHGHGTHVAGIIAAASGNGEGIIGAAPEASVMPVRVLDAYGEGAESTAAEGIVWAVDQGADVINLSFSVGAVGALREAVRYAEAAGVTVVAAAGNGREQGSPVAYPAAYPYVIAVGSIDRSLAVSPFSNRGDYLDLAAPGSGILSTYGLNSYAMSSGTSMAAPYVSAAAALLRSATKNMDDTTVKAALYGAAVDLGSKGLDSDFGHGLVDPHAALSLTAAPAAPGGAVTVTGPAGILPSGSRAEVTATLAGSSAAATAVQFTLAAADGGTRTVSALTDDSGVARAAFNVTVNSTVTAIATMPDGISVESTPATLTVVPIVKTSTARRTVNVTVLPVARLPLELQTLRNNKWVNVATTVARGGKAKFRARDAGLYRLSVPSTSLTTSLTTRPFAIA